MADNKTFLEKYTEMLTSGAGSAMEKLQASMGGAEPKPTVEVTKEREIPEFLRMQNPEHIPTASDILGVAQEKPSNTQKPAEQAVEKEEEPELPPETMDDVLKELDALIGLEEIKSNIRTLVNLLKIQDERRKHDLPVVDIGLHQAYLGNPGTGKTTIARIIGRIYKASGRLSKGHLIETDRSGLVGGYVGQTAIKTLEQLEAAAGGVLFVDEAYSLVPESGESDFGQEAITTILKFMEDNRDDFVLIAAGYPNEMQRFLDSNPGFVSRFNDTIHFPDYTAEELYSIFDGIAKKSNYSVPKPVAEKIKADFTWFIENKNQNFANGRLARKYFEAIVETQANRLSKSTKEITKNQLRRVTLKDLPENLAKLV